MISVCTQLRLLVLDLSRTRFSRHCRQEKTPRKKRLKTIKSVVTDSDTGTASSDTDSDTPIHVCLSRYITNYLR